MTEVVTVHIACTTARTKETKMAPMLAVAGGPEIAATATPEVIWPTIQKKNTPAQTIAKNAVRRQ